MSLYKELRGRDVPLDTRMKAPAPKNAVEMGPLDKKARSSSAGRRPSTADAMRAVKLSMSSRDIAKTGSNVSFDTPTGPRPAGARRNSVSIASSTLQGGGGTLPPSPLPPPGRSEESGRDAESLDGDTLHDVKSDINAEMSEGEKKGRQRQR